MFKKLPLSLIITLFLVLILIPGSKGEHDA